MTLRARQFTVLTLLLTFSVQLWASAVPPCPMLHAGADMVIHASEFFDSGDMGQSRMDHAAMGHVPVTKGHLDSADMSLSQSSLLLNKAAQALASPMTMDCCESSQNCDMDMCVMAPAVPSLVFLSFDFFANLKPAKAAALVFPLIVETLFHPPRFA